MSTCYSNWCHDNFCNPYPSDADSPTKTNFATLNTTPQTVASGDAFNISGSFYQNGIALSNSTTLAFYSNGLYSFQFIVTVDATQPGPLDIGVLINSGIFASGINNSTDTGLQVTGIGFVNITNAPTIATLVNYSNQTLNVSFVRLSVIKLS